mgnify:CR=1 FL=1
MGLKKMKKKVCMALSAMLALGTIPVYGQDSNELLYSNLWYLQADSSHLIKTGEKPIFMGAASYLKDGRMMLPLRGFLTAIEGDEMHWEQAEKLAWVQIGTYVVAVDLENRRIMVNGEEIPFTGEMEVRNGRTFLPLRNWQPLLNACGYRITEQDILWDAATKTVTIRVQKEEDSAEPPLLTGKGKAAEYTLPLSGEYNWIKNLGGGIFYGEKYTRMGEDSIYILMDSTGKEIASFDEKEILDMKDVKNGMILLDGRRETLNRVIDYSGKELFSSSYEIAGKYFDGLILAKGAENLFGYLNEQGEMVIPNIYERAHNFSEGMAAVCVRYEYLLTGDKYEVISEWGYINSEGEMVISPIYSDAAAFSEGLAAVKTKDGWGFVDRNGIEVIPAQYAWVTDFADGTAFAREAEGLRTWLINKEGKKLKLIAEGRELINLQDTDEILFMVPFSGWGSGDDMTGGRFFDKTGEISERTAKIRRDLSEGLAAVSETGKKFYVDEDGVQRISDTFDHYAEPFRDGYAVVTREIPLEHGGKCMAWGIIQHPMR